MLTFDYEGRGGVQGHDYVIMSFFEKGFFFGKKMFLLKKSWQKKILRSAHFYLQNFDYRKVACSNTSCLGAYDDFFRLLVKGFFYPFVL